MLGYFCSFSFKSFSQHAQFGKLGNILRYFPAKIWNIRSHDVFRPIMVKQKYMYLMDYKSLKVTVLY